MFYLRCFHQRKNQLQHAGKIVWKNSRNLEFLSGGGRQVEDQRRYVHIKFYLNTKKIIQKRSNLEKKTGAFNK